ncbi:MAG: phosphatase [Spirochaetaceae bacterium]|jgi:putative hydrolase|nr:phosphatase [Spirochaetaceae bacterium]
MKIKVDTHTHSIASIHAYSTIDELAKSARKAGLAGFVITEHGPALQGAPHRYYFGNLKVLPRRLCGVYLFHGAEINILDTAGNVDLSAAELSALHFCMAGLHEGCFSPHSKEENTEAIINALKNPYVDAISHPANPAFPVDYEAIAGTAAGLGKALEINNSSFRVRQGSAETCPVLAEWCAKKNTPVCIGSDAHYRGDVGKFDRALPVALSAGIKPERIINRTLPAFVEFIEARHSAHNRDSN